MFPTPEQTQLVSSFNSIAFKYLPDCINYQVKIARSNQLLLVVKLNHKCNNTYVEFKLEYVDGKARIARGEMLYGQRIKKAAEFLLSLDSKSHQD
jgi:hypothetical protein